MINPQKKDVVQIRFEQIRSLRQQLTQFVPEAGMLEVTFKLPNGETVAVPINNKAKARLLSKEVRNYLAEEQVGEPYNLN